MVKNLSVFFPAFNEEKNIVSTVQKAVDVLEKLKLEYEIIIVNDGSSDNTKDVVEQLTKENPNIKAINHTKNLGYGEALKSGFYNAKYDTICYNDGDGQFGFAEVTKFIEALDEADLIIGYRIKRADHPLRALFAKGWALSLKLFFGLSLKDVDCGFKMIKKKVLDEIPKLQSKRGGMINAELAIKAQKFGFRVAQVGVNHYHRNFGKPTGASLKVIFKSYFDLLKLWWQFLSKWQFFGLLLILALAAFFRLWNIEGYMTFLGDEGRDALVIKDLLVNHHLPFIGPPTSIGNIYLGPLYYYMMALPVALFWLNPMAAAVQAAIIGVLTVLLIYYLGKQWFGPRAGLISAFLYAISPVTIYYSRSSWNPNPAPFFALLAILGMYKAHVSRNFLWLVLTGFGVAAAVQMHYLALILIPIMGSLWIMELWLKLKKRINTKFFFRGTLLGILAFLILMMPLAIFDLRHNFMNYKAVTTFFLNRETTVNVNPLNSLARAWPIFNHNLLGRYITAENQFLTPMISVLILVPFLFLRIWPVLTLGIWLGMGILGLSLYKQNIYDHYLGFLNPVPYILLGSLIVLNKKWITVGLLFLVAVLAVLNFQKNPLLSPPNNQLQRTQDIAKFVIEEIDGKPFNFALLAKSNYDAAYQFYLDVYGFHPKQLPFEITDQLFVVCEDQECLPVGHPKYEIAAFGWSKIEKETKILGVRVFKLIHNPSGKQQ